jgi:alkylated DNA nucleotide flippase Atl1
MPTSMALRACSTALVTSSLVSSTSTSAVSGASGGACSRTNARAEPTTRGSGSRCRWWIDWMLSPDSRAVASTRWQLTHPPFRRGGGQEPRTVALLHARGCRVKRRPASASAGLAVRARAGAPPRPYARLVLDVVDRIPPGRVMTYGDVAELMGRGSPRTVGAVMSDHGREVPWQRVVQASGRPAEPYLQEALRLLAEEGLPAARRAGRPGGGPVGRRVLHSPG